MFLKIDSATFLAIRIVLTLIIWIGISGQCWGETNLNFSYGDDRKLQPRTIKNDTLTDEVSFRSRFYEKFAQDEAVDAVHASLLISSAPILIFQPLLSLSNFQGNNVTVIYPAPCLNDVTKTAKPNSNTDELSYPLHRDITATVFWIGEPGDRSKGYSSNQHSAWDMRWITHYGGFDDPHNRKGFHPAGFTPKQNPFYAALPYNDFDRNGRKKSAYNRIYWAQDRTWGRLESLCKNRWIRITKGDRTVYAQWQDVGPFRTNDVDYVFGQALPTNRANHCAGIDVSPAVRDYLKLGGSGRVDWRFVEARHVPPGPWRTIVTKSQICWK